MIAPTQPDNEDARLAALRSLDILDTLPEQSYDDLLMIAAGICGTPMGAITMVDADRQWFKARRGLAATETSRDVSFCGHAILDPERVFVIPDTQQDERFRDNPLVVGQPSIRFYAGAPVTGEGGGTVGTLCVFDDKPHDITPFQRESLQALSRQVAALLDARHTARVLGHHLRERDWYETQLLQYQQGLETRNADLAELSRTDALTGLPNRRAFDAALRVALDARHARGVAIALLDIDHFKTINDLHGHPVGDQVLAAVSQSLRASAGAGTMVARYGGEEFAVLLPNVDAITAELQAEYMRVAVDNLPLGFPVSISAGVSVQRGDEAAAVLIERADRALYEAKRTGRNRVVVLEV